MSFGKTTVCAQGGVDCSLGFSERNKTILEGPLLMGDPCIQLKFTNVKNDILQKTKVYPPWLTKSTK